MSEIPCAQPFEDGTHCEEPRGHELPTSYWVAQARAEIKAAQARAELQAAQARAHGTAPGDETQTEATEESK